MCTITANNKGECRQSPILAGFHKSRIVGSGFDIHSMKEWKAKFPLETLIAKINTVVRDIRPND